MGNCLSLWDRGWSLKGPSRYWFHVGALGILIEVDRSCWVHLEWSMCLSIWFVRFRWWVCFEGVCYLFSFLEARTSTQPARYYTANTISPSIGSSSWVNNDFQSRSSRQIRKTNIPTTSIHKYLSNSTWPAHPHSHEGILLRKQHHFIQRGILHVLHLSHPLFVLALWLYWILEVHDSYFSSFFLAAAIGIFQGLYFDGLESFVRVEFTFLACLGRIISHQYNFQYDLKCDYIQCTR